MPNPGARQPTITIDHLRARYIREDGVHFIHAGCYGDESPAYIIEEATTGEQLATVTVSMQGYGVKPDAGCIFVKDYGENEGLAQALVDANVIRLTGRTFDAGFAVGGAVEAVIIR